MEELIKKIRDLLEERETLRRLGIRYDDFYKLQKIELTIFAHLPKILDEFERRM